MLIVTMYSKKDSKYMYKDEKNICVKNLRRKYVQKGTIYSNISLENVNMCSGSISFAFIHRGFFLSEIFFG